MTWEDTCVMRVDSSGVAQTTEGLLTSQAISLGSTGVKTMSISQSVPDTSAPATDRIAIVMNFKNAASATRSWTLELGNATNEPVTAPLTVISPGGPRMLGSGIIT